MKLAILTLGLVPLLACVTEPDGDPADETPPATITPDVIHCPDWGCGQNSPVMGPYEFHELNVAGLKNDQGITILSFQQGNTLYRAQVEGAKLVAYPLDPALAKLDGPNLKGGWFNLQTNSGIFKLDITAVTTEGMPYWVGAPTVNETYELQYEYPNQPKRIPLCNTPPGFVPGDAASHNWTQPYDALLFTGDRYASGDKRVTSTSVADNREWFNVACAGSAIAKLHLNRHTSAGAVPGLFDTTREQRQAMLKMYVSDICGFGHAFTLKGTPLHWNNLQAWGNVSGAEPVHEAYWTDTGATCLDTHRLGSALINEITAACSKPACPAGWPRCAYLTTWLPFAVP